MGPVRAAAVTVTVLAAVLAAAPLAGAGLDVGGSSWQASALDLPLAWQVTGGSPTTVVAVVDSGVQADNPALQGRVLAGYDFVHGDTDTADDNGHGTAVAAIVASVCPGCSILPVKVLDANGTADWATVSAGIVWAADHGAQVINLSVGAPRALDIVGAAVAHAISKDAIVVAAAGNDGKDESFYPAMYPGVVSVAGVDQTGGRSTWSNFGSWVTVAAPGCATTAWLQSGGTADFCGTSAAAPFVAGVAGLARTLDPELDATAFSAALAASTTPLPDPATAVSGLPDANRLLVALGAPAAPPTNSTPPTVSPRPAVGRRSVASAGRWNRSSSYKIVWQRFRPGNGWSTVRSGTAYTPPARDAGYRLRVLVTASNVRGTISQASPATPPVRVPAGATSSRLASSIARPPGHAGRKRPPLRQPADSAR
jgi:subtilisin family serine protease